MGTQPASAHAQRHRKRVGTIDRTDIFTHYRELGAALAGIRAEQFPATDDELRFYEHCRREYRLTATVVDWMVATARITQVVPIGSITQASALASLADDPAALTAAWNDAAKAGDGPVTDGALRDAVAAIRDRAATG